MIGLVDGNNFYVSCERIFDLSLEGKPVAVLSNNDGCVISRSNEFKALKIPMGTPYFQLRNRKDLIMRSSNYELYGDISRRMIQVLAEFVPEVEQYSIDEAFIHPELPDSADFRKLGETIRATVLQWVGVPCGIGFAPSKTLAKIANHIGKKQPSGVFVMPSDPLPVLEKLPLSEIWGVGHRLAPKLEAAGFHNARQLAEADPVYIRKKFSVITARTVLELRGQPVIEREDPEELSQSITCSRSFGHPVIDLNDLHEAVASYTARAAVKLRQEKQCAAGVNIYLQYYPEYEPVRLPGGFTGTTVMFGSPTADTSAMLTAIAPKLPGIFMEGRRYKKAGVIFFGLEPEAVQTDLFQDAGKREKSQNLSAALDRINRVYGRGTLRHLSEGLAQPWKMNRSMQAPRYTTSWDDLLQIK